MNYQNKNISKTNLIWIEVGTLAVLVGSAFLPPLRTGIDPTMLLARVMIGLALALIIRKFALQQAQDLKLFSEAALLTFIGDLCFGNEGSEWSFAFAWFLYLLAKYVEPRFARK